MMPFGDWFIVNLGWLVGQLVDKSVGQSIDRSVVRSLSFPSISSVFTHRTFGGRYGWSGQIVQTSPFAIDLVPIHVLHMCLNQLSGLQKKDLAIKIYLVTLYIVIYLREIRKFHEFQPQNENFCRMVDFYLKPLETFCTLLVDVNGEQIKKNP